MEPTVRQGGRLLSGEPASSVFELPAQHGDVDAKIVAALERISQVFRVLLQDRAWERGLSPIQARFLVHLHHHPAKLRRVGRIAREFDLTPATVSDAVAALQAKGLVAGERRPEDRRVVTLRLTPRGERLASELSGWAEPVREHLYGFAPEEKETFVGYLMRLIASLQKAGIVTVARMCVTCRHFRRDAHPGSASPHHCALLDVPLAGTDLRVDCQEHESNDGSLACKDA